MTIREVYEKHKHLDALLGGHIECLFNERFKDNILQECWLAIKAEATKEQTAGPEKENP